MIAFVFALLLNVSAHAVDQYTFGEVVPLSFTEVLGTTPVTGLTVTVKVVNAKTNATLLSSVTAPEIATGAAIYTYNWTTGINAETFCQVTYTVGSAVYKEYILITSGGFGGRGT